MFESEGDAPPLPPVEPEPAEVEELPEFVPELGEAEVLGLDEGAPASRPRSDRLPRN